MSSRGSRAAAACQYCREKKLKCDAQKPACGQCLSKGVHCQQGPVAHKPRPTNQRIAQLEQENAQLRRQCSQLNTQPVVAVSASSPACSDASLLETNSNSIVPAHVTSFNRSPSLSRHRPQSSSQVTSSQERPEFDKIRAGTLYHGPTSTVYDDAVSSYNSQDVESCRDSVSDEQLTRHFLFARSARQRQLEPIDYSTGKLDFDGLDPEIGQHLLSIYWSRQLHTAQIIYRPVFMRDMARGGPYFSKLLLNAIMYTVCGHYPRLEIRSDPEDVDSAGWRFRQRFMELLRDNFDKSSITTIQALLIMSNSLFSRCDDRSLSWLYAGNAFNMIIDLGIHVLPSPKNTPAEVLEAQKRLLWGAYSVDKIQCLFQGRPPLLRHSNFKTSLEFWDDYDELEAFSTLTFTTREGPAIPSLNVSLLKKLCELSIIAEQILCDLYSESHELTRNEGRAISERITAELSKWRRSLPPQLNYFSRSDDFLILPQTFCLMALSCVLDILSQRSVFTANTDGTNNSAELHESVNVCTTAANYIVQILREYSQHFAVGTAPYMLSYATYISATMHARIVALLGEKSRSNQALLFCHKVLKEQSRMYKAAEKAKNNLEKLIAQLPIPIQENEVVVANEDNEPCEQLTPQNGDTMTAISEFPCGPFDLEEAAQMNWDLSNSDLQAIAEGFRLDGEGFYPVFLNGSRPWM